MEKTFDKKSPKQRDRWDKAQIITQIISGVIFAGIAVILSIGSSQISASIQKGQFLSGVIDDLTSTSNRGKRDIALIALDRFLGDSERELVADVAEQVIRNLDFDSVEAQIAFDILAKRDHNKAQRLLDEIVSAARHTTMDTTSGPSAEPPPPIAQKAKARVAKALERIGGNIVYIQFSGEENRKRVERLAKKLREMGYKVPGIEHRDFHFNDIRYFRRLDKSVAIAIAKIVENQLKVEPKIKDLSQSGISAPRGLVEVWIGDFELKK